MQIYVDGDACRKPRFLEVERIARQYGITVHIFCDTSRDVDANYAEVHIVDKSRDSADYAILKRCFPGDVVVTADSGLAAMALAKKCFVVNTCGFEYTPENIGDLLTRRYIMASTARKTGRKQVRGLVYTKANLRPFANLLKEVCTRTQ